MKVAIIHTRLLRLGGLESRLFNYMEWFVRNGHEVHLFVYKVGAEPAPAGVQVHRLRLRWAPKPLRAYLFDRKLRKILPVQKFDLTLSLGRTTHVDAVLVPGTHLGYLEVMDKRWRGLSDRLQIMMDRLTYASCGVLLPSSPLILDEMERHYQVGVARCTLLPPPLKVEVFNLNVRTQRSAERTQLGWQDDRIHFLLLSNNHALKGLPLMLEVFSRLQHLPVSLWVSSQSPFKSPLPNVSYLGHITDPARLYAAADFTVVPSQYESFGQVVAESIACGTPVLVSHRVGAAPMVGPGEGMVVKELTAEAWCAAIEAACAGGFSPPGDFVARHHLGLEEHMALLLKASGKTP